jgi:hypothetical protein
MSHGGPPVIWCVLAIGAGSTTLVYALRSIRRGWLEAGKPSRRVERASEPAEFWSGTILLALVGGLFVTMGVLVWTGIIHIRQ